MEPKPKPKIGVGGPGLIHLNHFGALIRDAYNEVPYLVGSAARGKQWRDVDVRLMLDEPRQRAIRRPGPCAPRAVGSNWRAQRLMTEDRSCGKPAGRIRTDR